MISIVVALVEMLTVSDTGPIGFLMNVLATCAFSCTAAFVYKKMHTKKGAVIGLTLGVICLTAVMLLWNYLITPFTGMDRGNVVVAMLITMILPFNVVKGGLNMALIPGALQARGHRSAKGPSGTGEPDHPPEQGARSTPGSCSSLSGPAGHLCDHRAGADGDSVTTLSS